MPNFDIIRQSTPSDSFRVKKIQGQFDLQFAAIQERFTGSLGIEGKEWNIGVIVGPSGTGKSTILSELFGDKILKLDYSAQSVVDDMPKEASVDDITRMFSSVGFASVPSWLKPYSVLSNGEKMRVDLANALLSPNDPIVFDEFTSVVDRQVARIGSTCIQKTVRDQNRRFIAVTCHYDVIEWLEPDWVFDTASMEFFFTKNPRGPKGLQSYCKSTGYPTTVGSCLESITI